eukprot:5516430-Pyramimonas_sp.AAC.1
MHDICRALFFSSPPRAPSSTDALETAPAFLDSEDRARKRDDDMNNDEMPRFRILGSSWQCFETRSSGSPRSAMFTSRSLEVYQVAVEILEVSRSRMTSGTRAVPTG